MSAANEREPGLGPRAWGGAQPSLILTGGRRGGPGTRDGGEHESRQRVPWRPDPAHRQTDRQKGGSQDTPHPLWLPSPAVASGDLTSSSPLLDLAGCPLPHGRICRTEENVQERGPNVGPPIACWGAGIRGLEALLLSGPQFPIFTRQRHTLRWPSLP